VTEVRILPEAEDDISEAAEFYNGRVHHLGVRFVVAVEMAIHRLATSPPRRSGSPGSRTQAARAGIPL
jgi:hypothetical protein